MKASVGFFFLVFCNGVIHADCIEIVSGGVEMEVLRCEKVEPSSLFKSVVDLAEFEKTMGKAEAEKRLGLYRGLLISGHVSRSTAVAQGRKRRSKALLNQEVQFFLAPPLEVDCAKLEKQSIAAQVDQNCCDGHAEVPCLTGTSYSLSKVWFKPRQKSR